MPGSAGLSELAAYQRRSTTFSLFNLSLLAAVFLLHVVFVELLGPPRAALLVILGGLFAVQSLMLLWSQLLQALPTRTTDRAMAIGSIAMTLLGALLASLLGEGEDHHYFVLMLPAIVLAAFRFGYLGTVLTAGLASAFTIFDVWQWFARHPPARISEFFEAATVSLLFVVVGLLVRVLAGDLKRSRDRLVTSLGDLERTRDRLVAEERLAAVGRLSSAIAHEIRNPVAMIASSLAAATRGGLDESSRAQMFAVASEEAARLERLTSDFLSYAHNRAPQRQPGEAASALGVVAELARARAAEAGVTLEVAPGDAAGSFDPFLVHQALLNLTLNAVQASPAGGVVRLAGRRDGEALVLSVENTGEPVPAEVVARVFEPFFTTRAGGTGLGLAIARRIAQSHGGDAVLELNEPRRVRFGLRLADEAGPEGR